MQGYEPGFFRRCGAVLFVQKTGQSDGSNEMAQMAQTTLQMKKGFGMPCSSMLLPILLLLMRQSRHRRRRQARHAALSGHQRPCLLALLWHALPFSVRSLSSAFSSFILSCHFQHF
jgi:hypothetical protein